MKRHALMIGVNDYGSEGALDFARSDAEFVGNAFRRQYDRTVVVSDRDATKTAVISELEQLRILPCEYSEEDLDDAVEDASSALEVSQILV